jgi:geranylgeranyl diphosphate synthase type I
VNGAWVEALDAAVGIEFVHKASLIHDDVVDDDGARSGRPPFHVAHGVAAAVAVSDLLLMVGLQRIAEGVPAPLSGLCLARTSAVLAEMAAGQLEDVFPSGKLAAEEDRLLVEERKTGSLIGLSCRLGAIVGGGTPDEVECLTRYGRKLGTAIQVLNDVKNLTGSEVERVAGSDVLSGRETVLVAHARAAFALHAPVLGRVALEESRSRMLDVGLAEYGESLALRLMTEARAELSRLPDTAALDFLTALTRDSSLTT